MHGLVCTCTKPALGHLFDIEGKGGRKRLGGDLGKGFEGGSFWPAGIGMVGWGRKKEEEKEDLSEVEHPRKLTSHHLFPQKLFSRQRTFPALLKRYVSSFLYPYPPPPPTKNPPKNF
jgi:hypothetical protein